MTASPPNPGDRIITHDGMWTWTEGDPDAECTALRSDFWAFRLLPAMDDVWQVARDMKETTI